MQRGHLPTPIPPGVIIDQVSNHQGLDATTRNKPMFATIPGTYSWRPSDTVTTPGSARQRVAQMVYWSGHNTDWRIPSRAELDPIFAGSGADVRAHLDARFGTTNAFANQPFIWTNASPLIYQNICFDFNGRWDITEQFQTHSGFRIGTNGLEHRGFPHLVGDCSWGSRSRAQAYANEQWANQRGGIIATRINPMVDYM